MNKDQSRAVLGVMLACAVTLVLLSAVILSRYFLPAEDAIILHLYSRNLAETGAISFAPHGPHAEGATDFLWMLAVALGYKVGVMPLLFTELVNVACILGISTLLLKLADVPVRVTRVLIVCAPILLLPPVLAALQGFSVLPFGMLLTALVYCLYRERPRAAALCGLLLCLLRPDGVVFAVPLLALFFFLQKDRLRFAGWVLVLFILPGTIYFLWRWRYFGQLFPLPFLVKSDVHRRFGLLAPGSMHAALPYLVSTILFVVVVCRSGLTDRKQRAVLSGMLAIPTLFYLAMRLDQNVDDRFFFSVPLAAILLIALNWNQLTISKRNAGVLALGLYAGFLGYREYIDFREFIRLMPDVKRQAQLAAQLDKPELHGTMLVSEAGLRPYYSRWEAYDSWGLNSVAFARHLIQPEQVKQLHPDLIVLHTDSCRPPQGAAASQERTWNNMVTNVELGIADMSYEVWRLPYSTPENEKRIRLAGGRIETECWYLADGYKGRPEVEAILRSAGAQELTSAIVRP